MSNKIDLNTKKVQVERPNISITCQCGKTMSVTFDWDINIVGILEFRCPNCSTIYRTAGLWDTQIKNLNKEKT